MGAKPAFLKSVRLVPKPMAVKAVTIRNLLVVFITPDTIAGNQPFYQDGQTCHAKANSQAQDK